jgi:hypothetical protein
MICLEIDKLIKSIPKIFNPEILHVTNISELKYNTILFFYIKKKTYLISNRNKLYFY